MAPTTLDQLAANLRRIREAAELSVDELAEVSKVGRTTIYRIEQAQMAPKVGTLLELAEALGVGLSDLLDGKAS